MVVREGIIEAIERKQSFAASLSLGAELAGYELDKQVAIDLKIDAARWSRIRSGTEGIKWVQLNEFMDLTENDVPLLWMMHQRHWDLRSFRRQETEYQREIRELRERCERLELEKSVLAAAMRGEK